MPREIDDLEFRYRIDERDRYFEPPDDDFEDGDEDDDRETGDHGCQFFD